MQWQKKVEEKAPAQPPADPVPAEPAPAPVEAGPTAMDEDPLPVPQRPVGVQGVDYVDMAEYRRCQWTLFFHELLPIAQVALEGNELFLVQVGEGRRMMERRIQAAISTMEDQMNSENVEMLRRWKSYFSKHLKIGEPPVVPLYAPDPEQ